MAEPWAPVVELAEGVRQGRLRAADLVDRALVAMAANEELGAFVHVDADGARAAAADVDAAVARGHDPGALAGVPFGVKDLEDCAGMPTSHGSLVYAGRPAVGTDSIHVARLRAAGAIPVGKTAAPEFGTTSWTRTKAFGTARNPWNRTVTPGGSSGGSAAAVAGGLVPMATASDGGGSTRIPASFSGLVGHKASYGRIPDAGASGSQTAVLGILATTVTDVARHLDVTAGPDPRVRTSLPPPIGSYEAAVDTLDVSGLRARWSTDLGFASVDREVEAIARKAATDLGTAAGLRIDENPVSLTDPVRVWLSSGALDLWLDLEDGMWPGVADDLQRTARSGLQQTAERPIPALVPALRRRADLEREVGELFAEVDVVLTPTTAVPAFRAEGPPPAEIAGRAVNPAMATPFTMLANLCWQPSVSVPAGLTASGLPVGLMITCRHHCDDVALRLARMSEQASPWPRVAP